MNHIKSYKLFEKVNGALYSTKEIINYIKGISQTPETDVPDYYFSLMKKESPKFSLQRLSINEILEKDKSVHEYVMSGEDRYEDSYYEPSNDELYDPIVIYKGEVIDGYNRLGTLYRLGGKEVDAYVSI